jgi:hypothetical protein
MLKLSSSEIQERIHTLTYSKYYDKESQKEKSAPIGHHNPIMIDVNPSLFKINEDGFMSIHLDTVPYRQASKYIACIDLKQEDRDMWNITNFACDDPLATPLPKVEIPPYPQEIFRAHEYGISQEHALQMLDNYQAEYKRLMPLRMKYLESLGELHCRIEVMSNSDLAKWNHKINNNNWANLPGAKYA